MRPHERIIVAADVDNVLEAYQMWEDLKDHVGGIKVGLQLGMAMLYGPLLAERQERAVRMLKTARRFLKNAEGRIMWDFKLHDIPNTVAGAAAQINRASPLGLTVHASGGPKALRKAVSKAGGAKIMAVTVLTSLDPEDCVSIFGDEPMPKVRQFAAMAKNVGVRSIVCSPLEAAVVREMGLLPITPGVRLPKDKVDDQARVSTPGGAIANGAHRVVVGRSITKERNMVEAAQAVAENIAQSL